MKQADIDKVKEYIQSPIPFVRDMWGITPQRENSLFNKGTNLTWQQHDILLSVERALRGTGSRKISVASGHGIGKSATIAWLLLWYLFTNKDAQVACTAPNKQQMYDVLWKEVNKWLRRMPPKVADLYE